MHLHRARRAVTVGQKQPQEQAASKFSFSDKLGWFCIAQVFIFLYIFR